MTLRLHFTSDDLARTRVAAEPHPMWELVLSLHQLQSGRCRHWQRPWRGQTLRLLDQSESRRRLKLLVAINPARGDFPDFLTPTGTRGNFPAALQSVLSTPKARLHAELTGLPSIRSSPEVRSIADGEISGLRMLEEAVTWYQRVALAPHWTTISEMIADDRNARAQELATGGVEQLLACLPGTQRWTSPVLHLDYPAEKDLHLRGRGITLVPSYFCVGRPVTLVDPELPPVLAYPLDADPVQPRREALTKLLGDTRAQILRLAQVPRSTTALAASLGASPGSVSKHTKVLRQAGLITSNRRGATMLHLATGLGMKLLATETHRSQPC